MPRILPSIQVTDPSEIISTHHIHNSDNKHNTLFVGLQSPVPGPVPISSSSSSPVVAPYAIRPQSSSFAEGTALEDADLSQPEPTRLKGPFAGRTAPFPARPLSSRPLSPIPQTPVDAIPKSPSASTIDPLSQHILQRTQTDNIVQQKLRASVERSEGSHIDISRQSSFEVTGASRSEAKVEPIIRDKRHRVSFLSRLNIASNKKRDVGDGYDDDDEDQDEQRPEGMNAHVFSSSIDANGYVPQHKAPPRYIKVRSRHKKEKEFNRMFLAQELNGRKKGRTASNETVPGLTTSDQPPGVDSSCKPTRSNPTWAMEFSRDGKYLAAAGQDRIVRVWAVLSSHAEREAHEREEDAIVEGGERLSAPVFASKPVHEFEGHTATVLDLSWSKNNFLLSSSMDKTVRLWHISRQECLCTFKHKDFVTSITFHPMDDRFFLAGSLDSVLRLWSIPDKSVAYSKHLPDLITAVAFSPDGKTAIAGALSGLCFFYDTEELKLQSQIHVRSSRGKNAKGSKITGIRCCMYPPNSKYGETKVLITTNDSRTRMYNLRDKSFEMKFKGNENSCSQIKASISDDTAYIICGSEDRKAYIWSLASDISNSDGKDKWPLEMFQAHSDMVTTAVIAPVTSRELLGRSGDPLYDLCNPPPVTLLSRAESNVSSKPPTDRAKHDSIAESFSTSEQSSMQRKPEESPGYILRSRHESGNIIVTADHAGSIKVFRQDCAYQKRRIENWEACSTFGRKITGIARSASVQSYRKSISNSRSSSVSQQDAPALGEKGNRIMSWRNDVDGDATSRTFDPRNDRSNSPNKSPRLVSLQTTQSLRKQPYIQQQLTPPQTRISSPGPYMRTTSLDSVSSRASHLSFLVPKTSDFAPTYLADDIHSGIPEPGFNLLRKAEPPGLPRPLSTSNIVSPKLERTGSGRRFWHMDGMKRSKPTREERGKSEKEKKTGKVLVKAARRNSPPSRASAENDTNHMMEELEEEDLKCENCQGTEFKVLRGGGGVCCRVCRWSPSEAV